ncbi:AMP-binding protein [Thiomonas sp. FB-Cd]|uniref:AMP-binding protein n=1 Tax=Thiomonas sp. FB-Cd TaxID=1158292 RepID=UPI0004DF0135|nr:AMP-binding protein [Thiomonas sp. FB-Cd]
MNIAQWLQRTAWRYGNQTAIGHGTQAWCTYSEFAAMAARGATWLGHRGVRPGDRVALFMTNRPEYLPALWAVWWSGAAAVPINAKLHPKEAAWISSHSGSSVVFTSADLAEELGAALRDEGCSATVETDMRRVFDAMLPEAALAPREEHDPAWLFYTSGTTGRPKGVDLGARQLRWTSMGMLTAVQAVEPGDVALHPAPISHASGMLHLPYVLQGGINVVPESGGFDAAECLALAAHWHNASFFAAPTMVRRLVDAVKTAGQRPPGLATVCYGGGPMYLADLDDALQYIGPHFGQIYGQGESPMMITALPRTMINHLYETRPEGWREQLASVGVAQSMVEVSVCDAQGDVVAAGETGEVCVRGDVVMNGYWRQPEATAATIVDGWLRTGDVGRMDEHGFLTLLDRSKDVIISGGTNIYPREVEEALLTHDDVVEVAVIGRPDPEWGEQVVAYIVSSRGVDAMALDAHCLAHIARFKRPKHYRFVATLPKNNYGKVLKTTLREWDAQVST